MKKIILISTIFFGSMTFAQEASKVQSIQSQSTVKTERAMDDNKRMMEKITNELELTREQQELFHEIVYQRKEADKKTLSRSNDRYTIENDKELEKELRAILTPEQNKKLDALKEELKQNKESQ